MKRGPLLACPTIVHYYGTSQDNYEPPHRPMWGINRFSGIRMPYAQNVGYTDGSVKFFSSRAGGYFDGTAN